DLSRRARGARPPAVAGDPARPDVRPRRAPRHRRGHLHALHRQRDRTPAAVSARRVLAAALLAIAMATPARAADPPPIRVVQITEQPPFLEVSVGMPDLVDDALRARLQSGFVTTILMRAYLHREGVPRPVGVSLRTYRLLYDVWEERYVVQIEDPQG